MKSQHSIVVGLDVGDKYAYLWIEENTLEGQVLEESRVVTRKADLERKFRHLEPALVALEVGPHSPWLSRLIQNCGHEVIVANAAKVAAIYSNVRKSDRVDAKTLAKLARLDPELLAPIQHRGEQAQADLAIIQSRDALVKARTAMINHVRGTVKALGYRLPKCSAHCFATKVAGHLPETLRPALEPVVEQIGQLTARIRAYERVLTDIAKERYPEVEVLQQVRGVGLVTSLAFILTLEDPGRFSKSRKVGAYLGLTPKRDESGEHDRQLRITKAGDRYLRRLLVGCAQYILGPFGEDSALRRYGLAMAERGGKNAKKRAVVAVARKLAVLLHRLWSTGEVYEPFFELGTHQQDGGRPSLCRASVAVQG